MSGYECKSWEVAGADGQVIYGNTHLPTIEEGSNFAKGVVLFVHGFLGYKDYGMFPYLAQTTSRAGFITHRFNMSHSGMTNNIETFERPDLFGRDTWNKQVEDLLAVVRAMDKGELEGRGLPYILFGHSRGGATVLLTAGRMFRDSVEPRLLQLPLPAGVIAVASPSSACNLSDADKKQVLDQGYWEIVSNRTGQKLKIDKNWLVEQLDNPADHDLALHVSSIMCPVTIVHGERDPSVPVECAGEIENWVKSGVIHEAHIIEGADHVFNTVNPMTSDSTVSSQLRELVDIVISTSQRLLI